MGEVIQLAIEQEKRLDARFLAWYYENQPPCFDGDDMIDPVEEAAVKAEMSYVPAPAITIIYDFRREELARVSDKSWATIDRNIQTVDNNIPRSQLLADEITERNYRRRCEDYRREDR